MKVYAIAETKNECHGHGDYEDVARIEKEYGSWPIFFTRELAEEILAADLFAHRKEIVEIEVSDVVPAPHV